MKFTSTIGLKKPEYSDGADIAVLNENMDTIDQQIKVLSDAISIGIPFNEGFTNMGYNYSTQIIKVGRTVYVYMGVKKTDGTKITANTTIPIFVVPEGFRKLGGSFASLCIGENGGFQNKVYGAIVYEGEEVKINMNGECSFVEAQLSYISV